MALKVPQNVQRCVVNTGNILSITDITRKSGQNPTEELIEAITITIKDNENSHGESNTLVVNRPDDDLQSKISEQSLNDLKIGLKIFLNSESKSLVREALEDGFQTLKVDCVHNVIIAYKKDQNEDDIESLKSIWIILEEYVKNQKIIQIGLADVEEATFRTIYGWAQTKPSIIQINLATCCVVPPTLQAFCKENDVQLLTHSDPSEILPKNSIQESFGTPLSLKWILRFLVHIKCRGVLITKGYLVSLGEK